MKDKEFFNELEKQLNNEDIALPESLSAENIEKLINENGSIVDPKVRKEKKSGKVIKIITSVAAAIAIIIGGVAATNVTVRKIDKAKQDDVIVEFVEKSDYSAVESVILNYYKDLYNKWSSYNDFDDILGGFGLKYDSEVVVQNSAADSAAPEAAPELSDDMLVTGTTSSHSSTNVQVKGVDEADIIKNDGRYIYFMTDKKVFIADCKKPENMNIVSEILINNSDSVHYYNSEMFLNGNQLVVVTEQERFDYTTSSYSSEIMCDCAYPLDSDTIIKVYDVSDKSAPELVYTQLIAGNYVSSRVVNDMLILVANYTIPYSGINGRTFEKACEDVIKYSVPEYSVNEGEMQKVPSDRIELLDEERPTTYIITSVVNLKDENAEPKVNAYLGGSAEIYCTKSEMFVADYEYSTWSQNQRVDVKDDNGKMFSCVTHIYKFDITDEGVIYNTDARVGGRCINQFSMDKNGDYFRIATCDTASMVYVLDKDMKIVGHLEGVAPGEDMKAARFMGDTLYLVTFFQTDPLFVVDISDPTAPVVKGELKIPGFSAYLHPIGNGLMIGVGEGGSMNGTDGSAKVSLFDVNDPYNPKELDNYIVPDAYFNQSHKAFMTIDSDSFALCVTKYGYHNNEYLEESEIVAFDIADGKIKLQGEYDTCAKTEADDYYWDFRGAFIKDVIFAVNGYGIRAYDMTTTDLSGEVEF